MLFLIFINVRFDVFLLSHRFISVLAGDVWICKPSGLNQGFHPTIHSTIIDISNRFFVLGKGIYLVRDVEGLKKKFAEIDAMDKKKQISLKPMKRIIQR